MIFCTLHLYAQPSSGIVLNPVLDKIENLFASDEFNEVIIKTNLLLDKNDSELSDSILIEISLLRVKAAYNLGKYKDVISYGEQGMTLVDSTDLLKLSEFWNFLSTSYIHLKDKPNAIAYLYKTLDAEDQLLGLDPKKVVTAYKDLGGLYSYFGDDDLSFENYRKGIDLFNELNLDNAGIRGDLYLNLSANFIVSSDHDSAFHYLNLAKSDYLKVYNPTHKKLGSINYNMSVVQNKRGFVFDAINLLKEAEVSWNNAYGENHPRMAYIQINRGQMALKVGDYEKALNSGFRALDILSKNEASDPSLIRSSHSTIGDAYLQLENYEKGLYHHELAFDLTLATYGEKSEFTYSSAANIADLFQSQSKFREAKPYIDLILKTVDHKPNVHYLSALHLLSKSAFNDMNSKDGFSLLDEAIAITNTEGKDFTAQKIELLLDKANMNLKVGALEEAHLVLEEINDILFSNGKNISDIQFSKLHIIEYHNLQGQFHLHSFHKSNDQNQLLESHKSFSSAIGFYKELMLNTGDQKTQFSLGKKADDLLANATEVIYLLYQIDETAYIEEALNIIESGKNLALKKRLIENNMINSGDLPSELRAREIKLNSEIAELKNEIQTAQIASNDNQYDEVLKLRSGLSIKLEEKESLIELYKNQYPKYFDLKFDNAVASLDDVSSNLSDRESIINFSLADSFIYVLILNNQKSLFLKIETPNDFLTSVQKFHASISSKDTALYSNLFQLVSNTLKPIFSNIDPSLSQKLLIIPDGILAYIPFEILHFKDDLTLGDLFEIHYSWSAKSINIQRNIQKSEILAIAPSYYDNSDDNTPENENLFAELVRSGNVPLPGAEAEVDRIKELFPTTLLKGSDASEANFKSQSHDYNILHLSLHGQVDNQNPLLSSLVFNSENDTTENGILEAWEIYNLQLNAELVVLSSCNTGYGKLEKSEGVMSLSRAFAHAGVPSAIMALWEVPDQSTSKIMMHFYQNLKTGQNKSAALRNAKKTYLENTIIPQQKHPFYWAGLVLTGNDDPIDIGSSNPGLVYGLLSFVLLLLIYFVMRRYK